MTPVKGAVIGLTRSLAREYGPSGICANIIAPGATDTEISQSLATDTQKERRVASAQARAIKRAEEPDDLVGRLCSFGVTRKRFHVGSDAGRRWRRYRLVILGG